MGGIFFFVGEQHKSFLVVLGEGKVGAPEDCHRQRKKVGQFFPCLQNSLLSKTTDREGIAEEAAIL